MREIKFRGKCILHKDWIYGTGILNSADETVIVRQEESKHELYPVYSVIIKETLGQYTGLKDKNSVEIYEGDIVIDYDDNKYIVEYRESTLSFDIKRYADNIFDCPLSYMNTNGGYEVIGNIHELDNDKTR